MRNLHPNTQPFADKVALVTGSGRGIGKVIALHFAELGANVVINYFRNSQPAAETAEMIKQLGKEAHIIKANVGNIDTLNHLIDESERHFGGIDFYISNAASGYNRPAMQQRPKGWDWTMNINARSFLFGAIRVAPIMERRGGGAMVSITSAGSTRVLPEYIAVGASKAALEAVTRYLAVELSGKNIVVNAVSPGIVMTDALKHFSITRSDETIIQQSIDLTPAGRLTTPKDIAHTVAFLCSPEASMIRGQTIVIDGGYALPVPGIEYSKLMAED